MVTLWLNDSDAQATEEMILNLAALLSRGELHLQGENNSQLNIPAQGLVIFQKQGIHVVVTKGTLIKKLFVIRTVYALRRQQIIFILNMTR